MVSQMAHSKNLGELCMAHVENLHTYPELVNSTSNFQVEREPV